MNLTALPTLQKIVLLKLAVTICSETEFKHLIEQYVTELDERSKAKLKEKMSCWKLPKSLQRRLKSFIKPVMMEISLWIFYIRHIHDKVLNFCRTCSSCLSEIDLQENLRWQTVGLIDKEQTSLSLIRDERLDTTFRFVLACNFCSETDILTLWERLSSDVQRMFKQSKFVFLPVVNYWTDRLSKAECFYYKFIPNPSFPISFEFDYSPKYLDAMYTYYSTLPLILRYYLFGTYGRYRDDLRRLISAAERSHEFRSRVTMGLVNVDNVAALKYFLKKFGRIKRQKLLEVVARNHFISNELLVFCVSQMSDDQLRGLLSSGRRSRVVSCLVNSPWQESFWDFIDPIWNDIEARDLDKLLTYILDFKMKEGSQEFDIVRIIFKCGVGLDPLDYRSHYRKVIANLMEIIEL